MTKYRMIVNKAEVTFLYTLNLPKIANYLPILILVFDIKDARFQ